MRIGTFLLVLATTAAAALLSRPAGADTTCAAAHTITNASALPFIISKAGTWCLGASRNWGNMSGNAITVNANDVVLDLNGYKLSNTNAGPSTQAFGIAAFDRKNVTIRNGTIQGFRFGIFLSDSSGTHGNYVVEDLAVDRCTQFGISFMGTNASVRRNRVSNTGGSTLFASAEAAAIVYSSGHGAVIADNVVSDIHATGTARTAGIVVNGGSVVIRHNDIGNHGPVVPGSLGVDVEIGDSALLLENSLAFFDQGLAIVGNVPSGLRDNVSIGCLQPFNLGATGLDFGHNN